MICQEQQQQERQQHDDDNVQLRVIKTNRFSVLGTISEAKTVISYIFPVNDDTNNTTKNKSLNVLLVSTSIKKQHEPGHLDSSDNSNTSKITIFVDIDEPYTRQVIVNELQNRHNRFTVLYGPGYGMEPISVPTVPTATITSTETTATTIPSTIFQWSEYERIDWDAVNCNKHKASSYMIRKGISRKAQLAYYTSLYISKNPTSILKSAIPQTVVFDTWSVFDNNDNTNANGNAANYANGLADIISNGSSIISSSNVNQRTRLDKCLIDVKNVMEHAEQLYEVSLALNSNTASDNDSDDNYPIWILKGSTTNKGIGIYIVYTYEEIIDKVWSDSHICREWVLQKYISTPLLLKKRKFHLRVYVLAVNAIQVYVYNQCLVLCSNTQYNINNTTNLSSHITNTCYQEEQYTNTKNNKKFNENNDCILLWNNDCIIPILLNDGTCTTYNEASKCIQQVFNDICTITKELFIAYQNELNVFTPINGCFEQYGFDFIIESNPKNNDWNVYLLEVNPGPDFKQTGTKLQTIINQFISCTIDIVFPPSSPSQSSSSSPILLSSLSNDNCNNNNQSKQQQHQHQTEQKQYQQEEESKMVLCYEYDYYGNQSMKKM